MASLEKIRCYRFSDCDRFDLIIWIQINITTKNVVLIQVEIVAGMEFVKIEEVYSTMGKTSVCY